MSTNDIEYNHPEASQNRLAYVMLLDAVLTSPDAVIRGLRYMRDDMVKADLGARLSAATEAQAVMPLRGTGGRGWKRLESRATPKCRKRLKTRRLPPASPWRRGDIGCTS